MTEQALPELLQLCQEGSPEDIKGWIERSITAFSVAHPTFSMERIQYEIVPGAYSTVPETSYDKVLNPAVEGKHFTPMAFMLGFTAGSYRDPEMAIAFEVILEALESMRFHYKLVYGIAVGALVNVPFFIVKVASTPTHHIQIYLTLPA